FTVALAVLVQPYWLVPTTEYVVSSVGATVIAAIRFARIDEDKLNEIFINLGRKVRKAAKENLMKDLAPHFKRLAAGRKIEGLSAYVN
ncbi:MAG: hypothetical protein MJZ49_05615, partial [Bacteroidales bacterium]|nr:hypothetical protein [Bacteroidales bacterium]